MKFFGKAFSHPPTSISSRSSFARPSSAESALSSEASGVELAEDDADLTRMDADDADEAAAAACLRRTDVSPTHAILPPARRTRRSSFPELPSTSPVQSPAAHPGLPDGSGTNT